MTNEGANLPSCSAKHLHTKSCHPTVVGEEIPVGASQIRALSIHTWVALKVDATYKEAASLCPNVVKSSGSTASAECLQYYASCTAHSVQTHHVHLGSIAHLGAPNARQLPTNKDADAVTEGLSFLHAVCCHHYGSSLFGFSNDVP